MADYSHLEIRHMEAAAWYAETVGKVTDGMLADAVRTLSPPLLPPEALARLYELLDTEMSRKRGRPTLGAIRSTDLADMITKIDRPDLLPFVQHALVARLRSGKRYTELERSLSFSRPLRMSRRDQTIRSLYRAMYELLEADAPRVHDILGEIIFPAPVAGETRSDQALAMTQEIMRERLGLQPPSTARMLNIISEKYAGKV